MSGVEALRVEVFGLRERVRQLERENEFLRLHPTFAQGLKGERFICAITDGLATELNASFDIVLKNGLKLEVKFSKLNTPEKTAPDTKRWSWSKPLGWLDKGKDYDFLLLVAERDDRFGDQYLDNCPYVVFLIPADRVPLIVVAGKAIGSHVNLTTNFRTVRSPAGRSIIEHMQPYSLVGKLLEVAHPRS